MSWVTVDNKKQFLKWFLANHQVKTSEARYLLDYLLNHEHILKNINFVKGFSPDIPNLIVVSSFNSDREGFSYYENGRKYESVSQVMGNLIYQPTDKMHLLVNFRGKEFNHYYSRLVQHDFFKNVRRNERLSKYSKDADQLLDQSLKENEIVILQKRIDKALDDGDKALFQQLVKQLKQHEVDSLK